MRVPLMFVCATVALLSAAAVAGAAEPAACEKGKCAATKVATVTMTDIATAPLANVAPHHPAGETCHKPHCGPVRKIVAAVVHTLRGRRH